MRERACENERICVRVRERERERERERQRELERERERERERTSVRVNINKIERWRQRMFVAEYRCTYVPPYVVIRYGMTNVSTR